MDQSFITRIVEAALLAAQRPVTLAQLNALFQEDAPAPSGSVARALETLREDCSERGVELVELASGFRYQVKSDVHPWVARLWTERQARYTRATLETLALIAYRQPITRGEIEQVRGVAVSSNIIRSLEEREWIRVVGHRDVPGKPELLATTKGFLDYFGLKRLDELPPLSELKDFGELDPQLQFEDKDAATPHTDDTSNAIEAGGIADGSTETGSESFSGPTENATPNIHSSENDSDPTSADPTSEEEHQDDDAEAVSSEQAK